MKKEEYIKDLLYRLTDRTHIKLSNGGETSENSVSQIAGLEAELLTDLDFFDILVKLQEKEKNADQRNAIYLILIKLFKNRPKPEIINKVFELLSTETKSNNISSALLSIYLLDEIIYLDDYVAQLKIWTSHKDFQIRWHSFQLLGKVSQNRKSEIEQFLICNLKKRQNKEDFEAKLIIESIGKVGTFATIDYLKDLFERNKKVDCQNITLMAIHKIDNKNQLHYFQEIYKRVKNSYLKETISSILVEYNDASSIFLLIPRIKQILSIERQTNKGYFENDYPELVKIIKYLENFESEFTEITKLIEWIKLEKRTFLDYTELSWLQKHLNFPPREYSVYLFPLRAKTILTKVSANFEDIEHDFSLSENQIKSIIRRITCNSSYLQKEKYVKVENIENLFKHSFEEEVFCRITKKFVHFYTNSFHPNSIFEVRMTPSELQDTNEFIAFDVHRKQWLNIF